MNKTNPGTLFLVATPIGNLEDITIRALNTLKLVDYILTERKTTTLKLLNHFNINKKLVTYREDSSYKVTNHIIHDLKKGKDIALVSEAGTPGFSDPGHKLIKKIYLYNNKHTNSSEYIKIVPIPGANAVATAISATPLDSPKFIFMGFTPTKTSRLIKQINLLLPIAQKLKLNIIYFESPKRLLKDLQELDKLKVNVCIAKELTKVYENIICDSPDNIIKTIEATPALQKGEFILIIKYSKHAN